MKITLNVKSKTNISIPRAGDVLVYDASEKNWFIVNRDELFAEYEAKLKYLQDIADTLSAEQHLFLSNLENHQIIERIEKIEKELAYNRGDISEEEYKNA